MRNLFLLCNYLSEKNVATEYPHLGRIKYGSVVCCRANQRRRSRITMHQGPGLETRDLSWFSGCSTDASIIFHNATLHPPTDRGAVKVSVRLHAEPEHIFNIGSSEILQVGFNISQWHRNYRCRSSNPFC